MVGYQGMIKQNFWNSPQQAQMKGLNPKKRNILDA